MSSATSGHLYRPPARITHRTAGGVSHCGFPHRLPVVVSPREDDPTDTTSLRRPLFAATQGAPGGVALALALGLQRVVDPRPPIPTGGVNRTALRAFGRSIGSTQ